MSSISSSWLLPGAAWNFHDPATIPRLLDDQRRLAGADGATPAARAADRFGLLAEVRRREAVVLELLLAVWRPAR